MSGENIENLDRNFRPESFREGDFVFREVTGAPFRVSGLPGFDADRVFCRLPKAVYDKTRDALKTLSRHTSGGAVGFRTNSPKIAIKVLYPAITDFGHMPRSGTSGFDLYAGEGKNKKFVGIAIPPAGKTDFQALVLNNETRAASMIEFTLNFPPYNAVDRLWIGVTADSELAPPAPFAIEKPIVIYGSSIEQGACASRPGNAIGGIIGRKLDAEVINLGFSGNDLGDIDIAEYIATLDMSLFVMSYEANAPSAEHLENTHEKFFRTIRAAKPDTPILIETVCYDKNPEQRVQYRGIVRRTYDNAMAAGDKNVYFLDGRRLFGDADRDSCTVDLVHPNDIGFERMATVLLAEIARLGLFRSPR